LLDLPEIARQVIRHDDLTLSAKLELFYQSALEKAKPMVDEVRATNRERYAEWLGGRPVCEVIFAAVERRRPIMYLAGIGVSSGAEVRRETTRESVKDFADERDVWPQGEAIAVNDFMLRPRVTWMKDPPLSVVKQLIGIAVEAKPAEVGGPYSIVRLTREGVVWIENGSCSPGQTSRKK
jgi:hypothetical protein